MNFDYLSFLQLQAIPSQSSIILITLSSLLKTLFPKYNLIASDNTSFSESWIPELVGNDLIEKNLVDTETAWYPQDGENTAPMNPVSLVFSL